MGSWAYDINPRALRKLYSKENRSIREVADIYGVSGATIYRALMRFGIPRHSRAPREGLVAGAKLTRAQAAEIKARLPHETQAALAAEYGVSRQAISHIACGHTHRDA